jgi:hypothetical protein
MRFSGLFLIATTALPLSACFVTHEEIAANDDAGCRSAGLKPTTPANIKSRCANPSAAFALPDDLADVLRRSQPNSKVMTATQCDLGASKVESFGLVVHPEKGDPLGAVIASKRGGNWEVSELPLRAEGRIGFVNNFLGYFWTDDEGFSKEFRLLCTRIPNGEEYISVKAHGEFVGQFKKVKDPKINHLCFHADDIYNSWVCFSLAPNESSPKISYVQFNAD